MDSQIMASDIKSVFDRVQALNRGSIVHREEVNVESHSREVYTCGTTVAITKDESGNDDEPVPQLAESWTSNTSDGGCEATQDERTIISVLAQTVTSPDLIWLFSSSLDQFRESNSEMTSTAEPTRIGIQLLHKSWFAEKGIRASPTYADFTEQGSEAGDVKPDIWHLVNSNDFFMVPHPAHAENPSGRLFSTQVDEGSTVGQGTSTTGDTDADQALKVITLETENDVVSRWAKGSIWLTKSNTVLASDVLSEKLKAGRKLRPEQKVRLLSERQRGLLDQCSDKEFTPSLRIIKSLMSQEYQRIKGSQDVDGVNTGNNDGGQVS